MLVKGHASARQLIHCRLPADEARLQALCDQSQPIKLLQFELAITSFVDPPLGFGPAFLECFRPALAAI
jgi:hypothetical protein